MNIISIENMSIKKMLAMEKPSSVDESCDVSTVLTDTDCRHKLGVLGPLEFSLGRCVVLTFL